MGSELYVFDESTKILTKAKSLIKDYETFIFDNEKKEYAKTIDELEGYIKDYIRIKEEVKDALQMAIIKTIDALYYDDYESSDKQCKRPYDKFTVSIDFTNNHTSWNVKYTEFSDPEYNFERDMSRAIIRCKEERINEWGRKKIKLIVESIYEYIDKLDMWCGTVEHDLGLMGLTE